MTKDELKNLYEIARRTESEVDACAKVKDTFEGDLNYRAALGIFAKAQFTYEEAVKEFLTSQVKQ